MKQKYLPEGQKFELLENRTPYYSRAALNRAMQSGEILEGIAGMCDESYCLTVDLGCMPGKIARSDVTCDPKGREKEIAIITRVGKAVCFCVTGFETDTYGKEFARLSRRCAQSACRDEYLFYLTPGDVIPARVTHLEPFGAFVDVGCGYVALMTIDCVSVSRISHPRERFVAGMPLNVVVKSIDRETGRIYVPSSSLCVT